jgi:hypothetical protein
MTNEQLVFVGNYSGQILKVSFARDDGVKTDVSCKSFPDFIEKNDSYLSMKFLPLRKNKKISPQRSWRSQSFFKGFLSGLSALLWHRPPLLSPQRSGVGGQVCG